MELVRNRQGFLIGETTRECSNRRCRKIFTRTNAMSICPECNSSRVKSNDPKSRMLNRAAQRARKSGLECTITVDDIVIPEVCPALGIPLKAHVGAPGGRPNSPSLDRIENDRGYEPGNVRVLSHMANMMKSSASEEMLVKFAHWVIQEYEPKLKRGRRVPR